MGAIGKLLVKDEKVFEQLLVVDALRGTDSTGIVAVGQKQDYGIAKQVGDPYNLFADRRYTGALAGQNRVLIGHNRWGTVGKPTRANAHPFDFENIVGVHNGTLDNKYALDDGNLFNVDSEALFNHIDKHGVQDAIPIVRGAWSLVWWEKANRTIHFLRNEQRPMNFVWNEKEDVLYFGSEAWMLKGILDRNDIKRQDCWEIKANTHLQIHVTDDGTLKDIVTEEIKGAPPFIPQQHGKVVGKIGTSTSTQAGTDKEKQSRSTESGASEATEHQAPIFTAPWEEPAAKIDAAYMRAKGVELEYICKARDQNGQDYCILLDEKHPSKHIRLYVSSNHNLHLQPEGTRIKADISQCITTSNGIFYKVSPWTVTIVHDVDEYQADWEKIAEAVGVQLLDNTPTLFKDHSGTYMNKAAFLKIHPECDGCGDAWERDELERGGYKFNKEKSIFCETCVKDYEGYVDWA